MNQQTEHTKKAFFKCRNVILAIDDIQSISFGHSKDDPPDRCHIWALVRGSGSITLGVFDSPEEAEPEMELIWAALKGAGDE